MAKKENIFFLATFPDPDDVKSPRGGYRRNIEMLKVLASCHNIKLIIAAPHTFQVDAGDIAEPVIIAASRMPVRWLKILRFLRKNCARTTPLIVYNPTLHTFPALWLNWFGYTVIVDYVDIQGTVVESKNRLLRILGSLVEWLFIKTCRQFITSSTIIQKRIQTHNPAAKVLLYRGTFCPPENASNNLPGIDLPPDVVKIMYLGMMQDFSGICELLQAFINLNPPNAYLYIAGHGPVKDKCILLANQFASGKVFFPELDDAHLHFFMQQMDILTVPYLDVRRNRTNFPSKIIEYLWAGRAILGTKVGEIQHSLEHERTAWLVPPTVHGLRMGLQQLIENQALRERLGQSGRREFERRYNPSVVAETLNAFISDAVNGEFS